MSINHNNKKSKGLIIIIEGLWHAGKTTYGKKLASSLDGVFIDEPDHLRLSAPPPDIEKSYFKTFIKIFTQAKKMRKNGNVVILDRSALSTLAFLAASQRRKAVKCYTQKIKKLDLQPDILIILKPPLEKVIEIITNPSHKKFNKIPHLSSNPKFAERYANFLYKNYNIINAKTTLIIRQNFNHLK